jgi:hypothetical protein
MLRGNEAHRVKVMEAQCEQAAQVLDFHFRRQNVFQALPRVARALDDFHLFIWHRKWVLFGSAAQV